MNWIRCRTVCLVPGIVGMWHLFSKRVTRKFLLPRVRVSARRVAYSSPCILVLNQQKVPGSGRFHISAASSAAPPLEKLPAWTECSESASSAFWKRFKVMSLLLLQLIVSYWLQANNYMKHQRHERMRLGRSCIHRTYGIPISKRLFWMSCFPNMVILSWMQSSIRHPPWAHWQTDRQV